MDADEIRKQITIVPFMPFRIFMSDGRTINVHARDFVMMSPINSFLDVFQPDGEHDILDVVSITDLKVAKVPDLYIPAETGSVTQS